MVCFVIRLPCHIVVTVKEEYSSLSQQTRESFTLVVHNVNSENSMQDARLANKGGKIGQKRNNQTSDQEYEKTA